METAKTATEEKGFSDIEPLPSPPMEGIEEFTIRRVGNPLIENGKLVQKLVNALHRAMHKKIAERAFSKLRSGIKFSRPVFFSQISPKIDQYGRVEMETLPAQRYEVVEQASEMMVDELFRSCGQNVDMVVEVFDLFWGRLAQIEYSPPELMSTLLICIQERMPVQRPQIMTSTPRPMHLSTTRIEIGLRDLVPRTGDKRIGIRVVSVREMLRHYFEAHPQRYKEAIAAAAGIGGNAGEHAKNIIEETVARIGAWEFAVRVWMQVQRWDMDRALEGGIIEPIDPQDDWILCPQWTKKENGARVRQLAHIIWDHYSRM